MPGGMGVLRPLGAGARLILVLMGAGAAGGAGDAERSGAATFAPHADATGAAFFSTIGTGFSMTGTGFAVEAGAFAGGAAGVGVERPLVAAFFPFFLAALPLSGISMTSSTSGSGSRSTSTSSSGS